MSRAQSMAAQFVASPQSWHHGEAATITPSGSSPYPTTFNVLVDRGEMEVRGPDGVSRLEYRIRSIKIRKADHETLVVNGDQIALPRRLGGSNVTYLITELLDQEGGFWTVGVN